MTNSRRKRLLLASSGALGALALLSSGGAATVALATGSGTHELDRVVGESGFEVQTLGLPGAPAASPTALRCHYQSLDIGPDGVTRDDYRFTVPDGSSVQNRSGQAYATPGSGAPGYAAPPPGYAAPAPGYVAPGTGQLYPQPAYPQNYPPPPPYYAPAPGTSSAPSSSATPSTSSTPSTTTSPSPSTGASTTPSSTDSDTTTGAAVHPASFQTVIPDPCLSAVAPNDPALAGRISPAPPVFKLYNCSLMTPVPVNAPLSYYCKPVPDAVTQPQVLPQTTTPQTQQYAPAPGSQPQYAPAPGTQPQYAPAPGTQPQYAPAPGTQPQYAPGTQPPPPGPPNGQQQLSKPLDPHFSTCAAAKASGYGHYRRGVDPEYDWYLDADHDGVVCE